MSDEMESEEIRHLFGRWRAWLLAHCSHELVERSFTSVATFDTILEAEQQLDCTFPADFKTFLLLCDGSREELVLPNYNSLLSLKEIMDVHGAMVKAHEDAHEDVTAAADRIAQCGFHHRWVPFANECSGCSITCIDLAPGPTGTLGQVIRWWDDGCDVEFVAESFVAWLRRLVDDLEGGQFHFNDGSIEAISGPPASDASDGSFCIVC